MKRSAKVIHSIAATCVPILMVTASFPAAAQAPMVMETLGPVSYICGGVGTDEQQALDAKKSGFNMDLLFTHGTRGEYMSDVEVKLVRAGQQVALFRAPGPRCLIKAPAGSYVVEATAQGTTKRSTVSTSSGKQQFRW
jgi:hypothetical protein